MKEKTFNVKKGRRGFVKVDDRRVNKVSTFLTDGELKALTERLTALGVSKSEYIRDLIFANILQ